MSCCAVRGDWEFKFWKGMLGREEDYPGVWGREMDPEGLWARDMDV